ncbi:MAG: hypothetical protein FWG61_08400 [Firmicutes bacterium]|nr:hypothetical protein [Bacillota bacterium]
MTSSLKKCSFVVQILDSQNQTWQGTVTWVNGKHTQPFRSLLELIKLMDSAINGEQEEFEEEE